VVAVEAAHVALAKKARFLGHGYGGPVVILPVAALPQYFGGYSEAGEPSNGHTAGSLALGADLFARRAFC